MNPQGSGNNGIDSWAAGLDYARVMNPLYAHIVPTLSLRMKNLISY